MGLLNVYSYMQNKTVKLSDSYQVFLYLSEADFNAIFKGANTDINLFTKDGGTIDEGGQTVKCIEFFECTKVKLPCFSYNEESFKYGNYRRNILVPNYESIDDLELTFLERYDDPYNVDSPNFDGTKNNNLLCIQSYVDLFLNKLFDIEHFAYKLHDYIPKIEVLITSNDFMRGYLKYTFKNLKLTSYDSYTLDYSSSSPIEWNLSFAFQEYSMEAITDLKLEYEEKPAEKPAEPAAPSVPPAANVPGSENPDGIAAPTAGGAGSPGSSNSNGVAPAGNGADGAAPPATDQDAGNGQCVDPPSEGVAPAGSGENSEAPEATDQDAGNGQCVDPPTEGISPAGNEAEPAEEPKIDINGLIGDGNKPLELTQKGMPDAPVEFDKPVLEKQPEIQKAPAEKIPVDFIDESDNSSELAELEDLDLDDDNGISSNTPKTAVEAAQALAAAQERFDNYNAAENAYMQEAEAKGGSAMLAREQFRMSNEDEFNASLGGLYQAQDDYNKAMKTEGEAAAIAAMGDEAHSGDEQAAAIAASNGRGARIPGSMYGPPAENIEAETSDVPIIPEDNNGNTPVEIDHSAGMPSIAPADKVASLDDVDLSVDTSIDKPTMPEVSSGTTSNLKGMDIEVDVSKPAEKTVSVADDKHVDAKSVLDYDPFDGTGLREAPVVEPTTIAENEPSPETSSSSSVAPNASSSTEDPSIKPAKVYDIDFWKEHYQSNFGSYGGSRSGYTIEKDLDKIDPGLLYNMQQAITKYEAENEGSKVVIERSGFIRTVAQQDAAYNKGVSKLKGGSGIHENGEALDFTVYGKGEWSGSPETGYGWSSSKAYNNYSKTVASSRLQELYNDISDEGKTYVDWGGNWKKFKDAPHFQVYNEKRAKKLVTHDTEITSDQLAYLYK